MLEAVSSNEIYDFLLLKTTKFGFIFTNMCWIIENNCKIWYDINGILYTKTCN